MPDRGAPKEPDHHRVALATWISAIAAAIGLVVAILTWVGIKPDQSNDDPNSEEEAGSSNDHPSDDPEKCGDRLNHLESGIVEEGRFSPPVDPSVEYQRSVEYPGRVTAHFFWRINDARVRSGIVAISGRMGVVHDRYFQVPLSGSVPQESECGTWYASYQVTTEEPSSFIETFDGLWAGETYCFAANVADGLKTMPASYYSNPICEDTLWLSGWGDPEVPH